MKKRLSLFCCTGLLVICAFNGNDHLFRKEQQKAPKVLQAYQEKWPSLKLRLQSLHIDSNRFQMFIRIFKKEKRLEVWLRSNTDGAFQLFSVYPVCASSGHPGPKRREGDGQVPEGFYKVSVFNPYSSYFVSLGLNYPNQSDRILGWKKELGGAIMIHGNCVTIGCVPITDDKIKEVYVLATEAKSGGQPDIPVHLFPQVMSAAGLEELEKENATAPERIALWRNIKTGYDYFENKRRLPEIRVAADGRYEFR
jgi:murein L,D-transpeptidase YafK